MKLALTTIVAATSFAVAAPTDYINFVRQIQQDSGVEWDVSVAPSGEMLSPEGVGPAGSLFQLWSIHRETAVEYLLDQEYVSSYTPEAAIEITTGDPYELIPRTRVDQPFTVTVSISGLTAIDATMTPEQVAAIPASARQVYLTHEIFNYPEGQHSLEGIEDPAGLEVANAFLEGNGTTVLNYGATSLTGPDLTKVEGEEVFTVSSLEDYGTEGEILESQKIQIWPIADAGIYGVDPTMRYSDLPPITVDLNDLYPDSTTYVRIYHGPPVAAAAEFTVVESSYVIINDSIPQDRTVVLTDIDDLFVEEGAHTLEVIHVTPFGTDLLAQYYPIRVDRTVEFRGGLYTAE